MNFMLDLLILKNKNNDNYNLILASFKYLLKVVYYKLVKIMIDAFGIENIILNIVIKQNNFSNSIIYNRNVLFQLNSRFFFASF